ncbi:MAG: hypothetical protein LBG80_05600 [Bacteroidales bacterium]|jgi:hypothetical protein|nr:hypothetical protein [Bacteroidales bacterium]
MRDITYWKNLVQLLRIENKKIRGRIVELIKGREKWKLKTMRYREECIKLKKIIKKLEKKLSLDKFHIKQDKPKLSHYSIEVIMLFLRSKLLTSCRFRSVSKVLSIVLLSLNLELKQAKTPSRTCGMLWVKKLGYYCITVEKEKAEDWILLLDESIGIGKETLLLILGIRRSQIDFSRPLSVQDMTPLVVKSRESWTGEDIFAEIEYCKQQLGKIIYATTDGSSTLKKALRLAQIPHVYDVTHAIAIMLEKLYKKDEKFIKLTKDMGIMRLKLCCSQYAHIMPPNQRSKSRFLNLDIISQWGTRVINVLENKKVKEGERDLLSWLLELKPFIIEMQNIMTSIEQLSVLLKYNGLNQKTYKDCLKILKSNPQSSKQALFNSLFIDYLDNNMHQRSTKKETIMCSDDVIETIFGRYKNELNQNPMNGVTDMVLIIPAMTSKLNQEEVMKAIDGNTVAEIKQWQKDNLCDSLSVKRNEFYNVKTVG